MMFLLAFALTSLGVVIANRIRSFEGFGVFSNVVILPLYQATGDDGYFWGRAISPLRQYMQALLRRIVPPAALGWLPGVRRDSARSLRLLLSAEAANGVRLALLRALGYRRLRRTAGGWTVERA